MAAERETNSADKHCYEGKGRKEKPFAPVQSGSWSRRRPTAFPGSSSLSAKGDGHSPTYPNNRSKEVAHLLAERHGQKTVDGGADTVHGCLTNRA